MLQQILSLSRSRRALVLVPLFAFLTGCAREVLDPAGDIARQQRDIIYISTWLMLLIIVPVLILIVLFAWRYRKGGRGTYDPDFDHSTGLELAIWSAPLLIIIALGALTLIGTHTLDPYRPLDEKQAPRDLPPLEIQVVALDWKWLFIYPELGVASLNEMAAPVDVPIHFRITSSSVWNTFSVPALAGMIYAMPGMETQLNAVMNKEGEFTGLSGHYSGSGFSRMTFNFRGLSQQGFDEWVAKAKASETPLDRAAYLKLDKPSEAEPVRFFGSVENGLYDAALGLCVQPGRMCIQEMHRIDAMGGAGLESEANRRRLDYDRRHLESGDEPAGATFPDTGRPSRSHEPPEGVMPHDGSTHRGGARP